MNTDMTSVSNKSKQTAALQTYYTLTGDPINAYMRSNKDQVVKGIGIMPAQAGATTFKGIALGHSVNGNPIVPSGSKGTIALAGSPAAISCDTYSTTTWENGDTFVKGDYSLDDMSITLRPVTNTTTICYYNSATPTGIQTTVSWIARDDVGGGSAGGGVYPDNIPKPDPCATAQAANATNIAKTSGYAMGLFDVKAAAGDGKEHSVALNSVSGIVSSSSITTSGETSTLVPVTNTTIATIHNHPTNVPPSAGDVYTLDSIVVVQHHSSCTTSYVVLPNGTVYALVMTDPDAAAAFMTNYPESQIPGYSPDFPGTLADEFNTCYQYFKQSLGETQEMSDAAALAFMLDKYNTGVALLKQNSDGSFSKLGAIQTGGSGDDATYSQNNCSN